MSAATPKGGHLITIAAVVFAGYALFETFKKPAGAVSTSAAQAQSDAGLTSWLNLLGSQASNLASNLSFDANLQAQAQNIANNTESTAPNF